MAKVHHMDALEWFEAGHQDAVDLIYIDPPFYTQRNHGDFDDRWGSFEEYLKLLESLIRGAHQALRETGNLILHLDWRTAHHARMIGDAVFSQENFQNEIIWSYSSGGASPKRLARKHDNLLWWSRTGNYTFNVLREPYATTGTEGRPGFHPDGRMLTDVWPIPFISTSSNERVGYATQKPLRLLERVVRCFSDEGDLIMDPMCGSGTTGVAAVELGRHCLLLDKNPEAVKIARRRLQEAVIDGR